MTRRHITLLLFLLSSNLLFSQIFKILHGTSFRGGENNTGTVFYQNPDNPSDFKSLSFDKVGPVSPVGGIMEASDGFLYLTTFSGGDFNLGTIVKLDADASNPTVIHHFNGAEGASTYATLTEGTDGNLYGTTYEGGMNDAGTVFKVGKDGTGFTVLHHFNGTDGLNPWGGVMEGSDGTLYGTTELGGAQDFGTLFKINTDGSGFEVLREFDRLIDGTISYGQLVEDDDEYLYGLLGDGGPAQGGTIFRVKLDGSQFEVIKFFEFSVDEGSSPFGTLTIGSDGRLYGTTFSGGEEFKGTVFSLEKDGSDFNTIHSFVGNEGSRPYLNNKLLEVSDGSLYGTTFSGGLEGLGTLFKLDKDGSNFTTIVDFNGENGNTIFQGVIEDDEGRLIGTAPTDTKNNFGLVYRVEKDGTNFEVRTDFIADNATGVSPSGSALTKGHSDFGGQFLGTTTYGGEYGLGTLFSVGTLSDNEITTILSFGQGLGSRPQGSLTFGYEWAYGTCSYGGDFDRGTIYRIKKDGSEVGVIYHFTELSDDGARPSSTMILASDGRLYGTTPSGGESGIGSVFGIDENGANYSQLASFDFGETGAAPNESLIEGSDGNLYGVTPLSGELDDGSPVGTAFSLNKDGTGFTILHTFERYENGSPSGPLFEMDGWLFGNTSFGGAFESGTIYRMKMDGSEFELIKEFTPMDGISPQGSLLEEIDLSEPINWLYGVTRLGGEFDHGTIFRISPDGTTFEKLADLQGYPDGPSESDGGLAWDFLVNTRTLPKLTGLSLSPNPTAGEFKFSWEKDFPVHKVAQVNILNGKGQSVFTSENTLTKVNELLFSTAKNWPNGIYFVKVEMEGKVFSERLIIQR